MYAMVIAVKSANMFSAQCQPVFWLLTKAFESTRILINAEILLLDPLQVQQALAQKSWNLKLPTSSSSSHITTQAHMGSITTQASDRSAASSYGFMGPGTGSPALTGGGPGSGRELGASVLDSARRGSFSAASDDRASSLGKNSILPGLRSQDCSFTSAGNGQGADSTQQPDVEAGLGSQPQQHEHGHQQRHVACTHASCADDILVSKDISAQPLPQQQIPPQQSARSSSFKGWFRSDSGGGSSSVQQLDGHSELMSGSAGSSRPASRLASAGSALMHRLSQVVRGGLHSGLLQPLGADGAHGPQELRLSVRIGVATGWFPYGCSCSLDSSAVFVRAKSK
jgi:hypothetical protein